jgi:tetratricopeptide (TPR) repeat protein
VKARTILFGFMLLSTFCAIAVPARAQTGNSQQTLNQYVAGLQSNPNDTALRQKIIALALTMDPLPDVPSEARRHMSRGVAAVEDAKTPDDFKDACNEFQQAATLAPWMANAYRNLAIAQDKAGLYDDALGSLRLYLLTQPSSADAGWADDLRAKLEYRKEKAAKAKEEENSPQAAAAREQKSFEDLLRKVDGRRYTHAFPQNYSGPLIGVIDIHGRFFTEGTIYPPDINAGPNLLPGYHQGNQVDIQGRVTNKSYRSGQVGIDKRYSISEEGDTITLHVSSFNPAPQPDEDDVYVWQR